MKRLYHNTFPSSRDLRRYGAPTPRHRTRSTPPRHLPHALHLIGRAETSVPHAPQQPVVVVIVGPTASGKSALAVALARRLGGEVISADSRQVYRGLDIATGKITKKEMRGIPHHLLSIANPKKQFSADDFVRLGRKAIADIHTRNKLPIICGGTGFYIDALLGNCSLPNVPPNHSLRKQLKGKTAAQLFAQLKKLDPRRARGIERQNPVRLIRAIEIAKAIGKVPLLQKSTMAIYRHITIGIKPVDRELKRRIRARVTSRMRRGMVAEAQHLTKKISLKRMRELGLEYRHLADYLEKKISKEELIRRIERDDWRYAKRQMRWFRRNKETQWISRAEIVGALRVLPTLQSD